MELVGGMVSISPWPSNTRETALHQASHTSPITSFFCPHPLHGTKEQFHRGSYTLTLFCMWIFGTGFPPSPMESMNKIITGLGAIRTKTNKCAHVNARGAILCKDAWNVLNKLKQQCHYSPFFLSSNTHHFKV